MNDNTQATHIYHGTPSKDDSATEQATEDASLLFSQDPDSQLLLPIKFVLPAALLDTTSNITSSLCTKPQKHHRDVTPDEKGRKKQNVKKTVSSSCAQSKNSNAVSYKTANQPSLTQIWVKPSEDEKPNDVEVEVEHQPDDVEVVQVGVLSAESRPAVSSSEEKRTAHSINLEVFKEVIGQPFEEWDVLAYQTAPRICVAKYLFI